MAAPSYTTDLSDITLCESTTNWQRWRGAWTGGGNTPIQDGEAVIQGTYCISKTFNSSGTRGGLNYNYGSGISFGADDVIFAWHNFAMPQAVDSEANGGIAFAVGHSDSNAKGWYLNGDDRHPYGGWRNYAIDPTHASDMTIGTFNGTYQYFGFADILTSAVSKGEPFNTDAMRYGRGDAIFRGGNDSSGDRCDIDGFVSQNDDNSNRWGLIQAIAGGFLWKGRMLLGVADDSSSATEDAVDFYDSDKIIFIDYTPKVYSYFNSIEINNENSIVTMLNFQFICLDPENTASKGRWLTNDNADVDITGSAFVDMDTFIFLSNTTAENCTFTRCGEIDAGGAELNGSKILESSVDMAGDSSSALPDKSALVWDVNTNPNGHLDDMTFTKGDNTHHAIEFGTNSPTTMTLNNPISNGFNASNDQDDSFFHIKRTSGTVTINVVGGTGNFSYRSDGATVVINTGKVLTLTGIAQGSEVTIMRAGDDSSAAELYHLEEVATDGEAQYSYDTGGVDVDILIMHLDYEPYQLDNYTLPTTDTDLPINQIEDRYYDNP